MRLAALRRGCSQAPATREADMGGFRIGSVFGIDIRIDYSWFVIFFLILWTLTVGVFPATRPGLDTGTYVAMGASATILFFISLLGHELSHSLVARSKGIPVEGITLFIFGGMAHTRMEFEEPGDEFLIAGVGPVSSFVFAALFWVIAWAGRQFGWPFAITDVAGYLAFINLILAIFNLFPGFPLDGGRLFRALVWKVTGDLRKATRIASTGGKIFGYALILLGALSLIGGNLIGGIWLIFIGWFVRTAAEASYTQYVLRRTLEGIRARDAMTPDPDTVAADLTLEEFVEAQVFRGRHHSYPVVENGEPVGLITLDRVRGVPREEWPQRSVRDAMAPASDALMARRDDSMATVLEKLGESKLRRVLVTHESRLVGILSQSDVARLVEREEIRETLKK
jgi:Zn-dependent protease/CBS domain-containing protein